GAWQEDRHDLPGPAHLPEPRLHGRSSDLRGRARPQQGEQEGRHGPIARVAEDRGDPFPRTAAQAVSTRTLRRYASARRDRHRDGQRPRRDHRRRAHHRIGRHGPGPGVGRPAGGTAGDRAGLVLITHDLGVVAGQVERVAVMYAGRIVENGPVEDVFYRSQMPYALGLLGSLPRLDGERAERLTPILGTPPSLTDLPKGCGFAP